VNHGSRQRLPWRSLAPALLLATPVLVGALYAALASVRWLGAGKLGAGGVGAGGGALAAVTLDPWRAVLGDPGTWTGLLWTLWVAGASTGLAAVGAILLALVFRGTSRLDRIARGWGLLPLPIPHLVAGVSGLLILGQSGVLARAGFALGLIDTPAAMPALVQDPWGIGVILALTWKELPFLALVAFSILALRGPALEEAARTLGAPPREVAIQITLPLLVRGMLPALVAVFTFVVGSWEVSALLAPSSPMALPLQILERHTDPALARRSEAHVLTLMLLALALTAVAVHEWIRRPTGDPAQDPVAQPVPNPVPQHPVPQPVPEPAP
jgi:putative spermidine/putrescine transport system permease protein